MTAEAAVAVGLATAKAAVAANSLRSPNLAQLAVRLGVRTARL